MRYQRHSRHRRYVRHERHGSDATPKEKIKTVGKVQYSADGESGWQDTIPAGLMKVSTPLTFYIRAKEVDPADDGSYIYKFQIAAGTGDALSLQNTDVNKAKISGTAPEGMLGKTFSVNCTVEDSYGTEVTGTALTQAWSAASVV